MLFRSPEGGGPDVFAHFSAIEMEGFRTLKQGGTVGYELVQGPKGNLAQNIRLMATATATATATAILAPPPLALVLLCYKFRLAFRRRQHGHRSSALSKAAAILSRKVVIEDGTWRCVRWASARFVMRG